VKERALSPKQQKFVEIYAACGNATEAARQAGYRKPREQGAQNLSKLAIKIAVAALTERVASQRIATVEERQQFWTAVLRGEESAEMKDRLKASELLGKCQGDFIERVESSGIQEIIVRYVRE